MDYTVLLIVGAAAVSVFMAAMGLLGLARGGGTTLNVVQRIERASGRATEVQQAAEPRMRLKLGRWLFDQVRQLGERVAPEERDALSEERVRFLQAGLRHHQAPLVFLGARLALMIVFVSLAFLLPVLFPSPAIKRFLFLLVTLGALIGYAAPGMWLKSRTTERKRTLLNELPDALDLLVVCVEAGMGLDQAIERVSREVATSAPEISKELKLLTLELRAGKKRHDALRAMSLRIGLDDVDALVTLLVQADSFGTSGATTLRVYSETMRTRRFQRAEETAAKLPVKLLFPLVLFILPALFVVIVGPAGLQLMDVFARINP